MVEDRHDLYVVMEYVHGLSLAGCSSVRRPFRCPSRSRWPSCGAVLLGLHAAHEARDEEGAPARNRAPGRLATERLVGADGVPRLIDFGIAKAATRAHVTDPGVIKGKAGYMAPEQLLGEPIARLTDVFSASVVLWELLAGRPLFPYDLGERIGPWASARPFPSPLPAEVDAALDAVVLCGLERDPSRRFPTAEAMMVELRGIADALGHRRGPVACRGRR